MLELSQDYSIYILENKTKLTPKEALGFYKKAIKLK
ncbi:MAG: hypothetical protein K0R77_888 [Chryseobacterium sp.]|jgi:hypothetical protein|nr:hypothetical protein [Chryseobacterium sp.]